MRFQDQPMQVAMKLKELARTERIAHVNANGWSFVYNTPEYFTAAGLPCPMYGFSAMLYPKGRGSTVEDWHYLGEVIGSIGSPPIDQKDKFTFWTDAATANPNSILKWLWKPAG